MSAGTLTLVNNSVNVVGVGTAFTTDLKVNDFIAVVVGGATYTMAVKSITNATNIVVTRPYAGPSQSGVAWSAVPNGTMVGITVKVAEDTSYTMRMYVNEATNWMNLLTVNDNVTVTAPDGSTFTGPSWKYLSDNAAIKSGGAVPVNQGGTGGRDVPEANTSLGTLFNRNIIVQPNSTSLNDYFGPLGSAGETFRVDATNTNTVADFPTRPFTNTKANGWGPLVSIRCDQYSGTTLQFYHANDTLCVRSKYGSNAPSTWAAQLNDLNTTVDSNGFIKRASPIVKVYGDGASQTNSESDGATVTREDIGVYRISGVLGMNSDRSWGGNGGGIEVPKDINGQPRVWVDYGIDPDGSIILRTYHRTHPDAPAFARNLIGTKDDAGNFTETVLNGEPIDIPDDVFIPVRVEMPTDSVYNQSLAQHRD